MYVIFALTSQISSLLWPSGLPYYQDSSTQQVRKLNTKQLKEKENYTISYTWEIQDTPRIPYFLTQWLKHCSQGSLCLLPSAGRAWLHYSFRLSPARWRGLLITYTHILSSWQPRQKEAIPDTHASREVSISGAWVKRPSFSEGVTVSRRKCIIIGPTLVAQRLEMVRKPVWLSPTRLTYRSKEKGCENVPESQKLELIQSTSPCFLIIKNYYPVFFKLLGCTSTADNEIN